MNLGSLSWLKVNFETNDNTNLLNGGESVDNDGTLKNAIIKDLGDSINLLYESMTYNNQNLSPFNIYATGDLVFLVILLGKGHTSPY